MDREKTWPAGLPPSPPATSPVRTKSRNAVRHLGIANGWLYSSTDGPEGPAATNARVARHCCRAPPTAVNRTPPPSGSYPSTGYTFPTRRSKFGLSRIRTRGGPISETTYILPGYLSFTIFTSLASCLHFFVRLLLQNRFFQTCRLYHSDRLSS